MNSAEVVDSFMDRVLEARRIGDTELTAARERLASDVTVRLFSGMPYGGFHVGRDAFVSLLAAVPNSRRTLAGPDSRTFVADDDHVVAEISFEAKWLATGRVTKVEMIEIYVVGNDQIQSLSSFYGDTAEIVAASRGVRVMPETSPATGPVTTFDFSPASAVPGGDLVAEFSGHFWQALAGAGTAASSAAAARCLDPAVQLRLPASLAGGGTYAGHDGFATMVTAVSAAWQSVGEPVVSIRNGGTDRVLIHTVATLRSRESGADVPLELATMCHLCDGLIDHVMHYPFDVIPLVEASNGPRA